MDKFFCEQASIAASYTSASVSVSENNALDGCTTTPEAGKEELDVDADAEVEESVGVSLVPFEVS